MKRNIHPYLHELLSQMEENIQAGGNEPYYRPLKSAMSQLSHPIIDSFRDWHLRKASLGINSEIPRLRWPNDAADPYLLVVPAYTKGLLSFPADKAQKQRLILRYVANGIAKVQLPFIDSTAYHYQPLKVANLIKTQANGTLIVTQSPARAKHWARVINQCASHTGHSGYLKRVLSGETDHGQTDLIALLMTKKRKSLQTLWRDPVLSTGLGAYLDAALAMPWAESRAEVTNALALYQQHFVPVSPVNHEIAEYIGAISSYNKLTRKIEETECGIDKKTALFLKRSDLMDRADRAYHALKERFDPSTGWPRPPKDLMTFDEDRLYNFAGSLLTIHLHQRRSDELGFWLAYRESLIRFRAEAFKENLQDWIALLNSENLPRPIAARKWAMAFFCFPVICTTVDELPDLLNALPKTSIDLAILDQEQAAFAPEVLLSVMGSSNKTILLRGD